MVVRVIGLILAIAITAHFAPFPRRLAAAESFHIADEISIDGPALFYAVEDDIRNELWSVHCVQPLRGCVARAPGFVLRLDEHGQPWLLTMRGANTELVVETRNTTEKTPTLLTRPLDDAMVDKLSDPSSFIVVKEKDTDFLRIRSAGLDHVVSYLEWVNGNTARTLRDARLWPKNGHIRIQDMSREVLERYEVMQRRALEAQKHLMSGVSKS